MKMLFPARRLTLKNILKEKSCFCHSDVLFDLSLLCFILVSRVEEKGCRDGEM